MKKESKANGFDCFGYNIPKIQDYIKYLENERYTEDLDAYFFFIFDLNRIYKYYASFEIGRQIEFLFSILTFLRSLDNGRFEYTKFFSFTIDDSDLFMPDRKVGEAANRMCLIEVEIRKLLTHLPLNRAEKYLPNFQQPDEFFEDDEILSEIAESKNKLVQTYKFMPIRFSVSNILPIVELFNYEIVNNNLGSDFQSIKDKWLTYFFQRDKLLSEAGSFHKIIWYGQLKQLAVFAKKLNKLLNIEDARIKNWIQQNFQTQDAAGQTQDINMDALHSTWTKIK